MALHNISADKTTSRIILLGTLFILVVLKLKLHVLTLISVLLLLTVVVGCSSSDQAVTDKGGQFV
jgi:hypothetical protein